jgi:hypothetical protein
MSAVTVAGNANRITNPATEKAQLVEFLDFECEACRAAGEVRTDGCQAV